ncbi:MAG: endonuclease III [Rhizobiales bacterium]|nr:endonuclease III [Hyphomicrobiales bacterium]MBO6699411.1 endonuclease III [Hyphomicrobiales bacterium]MBO6736949.1 endonuclease III [Hyphomicrobiales bacterium]MBO6911977.1 endonuclease III [Hyphomicrobiales bacterium]MBO6954655.1 endonuclease III [Hyphomicrobiales bacterium]
MPQKPSRTSTKPAVNKPATKKRVGRSRLKREEIDRLFAALQAIEPEPKGELEHVNAYTLLVAVVLSAQATDAGVNKATRGLFAIADTPDKMLALGEDTVREHVKTIGLYKGKAKNVMALSQRLLEEHPDVAPGHVPEDRDYLESLPGVGRKTANVVMNMAFGHHTNAVDTHVFRVSNRTGLAPGKTVEAVEAILDRVVPEPYGLHAHHWLILHGRYLCKARTPECWRCPVIDICKFKDKVPNPADAPKKSRANKAS